MIDRKSIKRFYRFRTKLRSIGKYMEGSVQNKERLWTKRRHAKQLKLEMANQYTDGVVIPTQDIIKVLETLITPGDKVVLEGNNQKQADFYRALWLKPIQIFCTIYI